jgi:hypothetical protein
VWRVPQLVDPRGDIEDARRRARVDRGQLNGKIHDYREVLARAAFAASKGKFKIVVTQNLSIS